MEKSDFDRLLERYLTGQVSEEERIKIEAWLNVLKTEDNTNLELSKDDEDRLFQKISGNADEITFQTSAGKRSLTSRWLLRIAASLTFLLAVSYLGWYLIKKDGGQPALTSKGVEKMILNDGTLVWLRGESKLSYFEKKDEGIRYAILTGEALFEVVKDPLHPFIIQCGDLKLKVLGTSFNVKTGVEGLELKVLTGRVNVSSEKDHLAMDVEPNEKVIYKANTGIEKFSLGKNEVVGITAHTEYNMQFNNTTLREVIGGIAKKFDVTIELANEQTGKCRITADFTDHSLESSLQMITEVLDVAYTRKRDVIMINGRGCN